MRVIRSLRLWLCAMVTAGVVVAPPALRAQATGQVAGTVTSETGAPLAGASVSVGSRSAQAGADGRYIVSGVPAGSHTVRASLVGYNEGTTTVQVAAGQTATANLRLTAVAVQLEGLVAVGYGTQKKVNLTGAVGTVETKQLTERPVARVTEALQGSTPGLTVIQRSAQPGRQNIQFNIRGRGSFNNTTPLVLIDGVAGDINQINASDIASISVLKDAASAAIYGSRAANGVVLITTKRGGATGGLRMTYNGYYGIQGVAHFPKVVGPREYMELINEASANAGFTPKYSEEYIQNTLKTYNGAADADPIRYPWTDWLDTLFDPAPIQDHTVGLSGGNEVARFNLSLNYFDHEGMSPQTWADRVSVRLNTDYDINDRLSAGVDVALRQNRDTEPHDQGGVLFRMFHDTPPMVMPKYPDGTYGWSRNGHNPLAYAEAYGTRARDNLYGNVNAKVDYEVTDDFTVRTMASTQLGNWNYRDWRNQETFYDYFNPSVVRKSISINRLDQRKATTSEIYLRGMGEYSKALGDHALTAIAGYEQTDSDWNEIRATREGFYANSLREINAGDASRDSNWGTSSEWRLRSGFGRLSYNYAGRYLLEGNARYDGSSRFAQGQRFGFFPSFSAGWRLSEESFFNLPAVSDLKLRASWGRMGNQNIGNYRYYQTVSFGHNYVFGDQLVTGAALTSLANTAISWESTEMSNLGVDAEFLDGRLTFTGDVYKKTTDGILMDLPIPGVIGLGAPVQNAGVVENKGWEASLSWRDLLGELDYSLSFNLSDNQNKIVSLAGTGPYIEGLFIRKEGLPLGSMWGYEALGLFRDEAEVRAHAKQPSPLTGPGDIKFKDQNGDGRIDNDDKVVIGNDQPRFALGSNLSASYKGFDLGLFFQGVLDADVYLEGALAEGPVWENFTTEAWLDRWTKENPNPNARMPKPSLNRHHNHGQRSSFWVKDASYVKLKTAQFGYQLPESVAQLFRADRMRVYLSGQNVLTFSRESLLLDPEFPSGRGTVYPQTRTVSFGTSIQF